MLSSCPPPGDAPPLCSPLSPPLTRHVHFPISSLLWLTMLTLFTLLQAPLCEPRLSTVAPLPLLPPPRLLIATTIDPPTRPCPSPLNLTRNERARGVEPRRASATKDLVTRSRMHIRITRPSPSTTHPCEEAICLPCLNLCLHGHDTTRHNK